MHGINAIGVRIKGSVSADGRVVSQGDQVNRNWYQLSHLCLCLLFFRIFANDGEIFSNYSWSIGIEIQVSPKVIRSFLYLMRSKSKPLQFCRTISTRESNCSFHSEMKSFNTSRYRSTCLLTLESIRKGIFSQTIRTCPPSSLGG